MRINFYVAAVPVAQPRQRHRVITTKDSKPFASNYTPKKDPVNSFKATVSYTARQNYTGPVLDQPIGIYILFVFPRPKRIIWKTKPMPREWLTGKPDVDNLQKSVYDALNSVIWRDDSLVCRSITEKVYASGSESPHVEITIETLGLHHKIGSAIGKLLHIFKQ